MFKINPTSGSRFFSISRSPVYVVQTEKGPVEMTGKELKKHGIDPNNNNKENWLEKLWGNVKDVLFSFFMMD